MDSRYRSPQLKERKKFPTHIDIGIWPNGFYSILLQEYKTAIYAEERKYLLPYLRTFMICMQLFPSQ